MESTTIDLDQCRLLFEPLMYKNVNDWNALIESLDENNICVKYGNSFGFCIGKDARVDLTEINTDQCEFPKK